MKDLRLNEKIKTRLKHPLGTLILGPPEKTMSILEEAIKAEKPSKVCVVGDFTALKTIEYNIEVDLFVVDKKVMRNTIEFTPPAEGFKVFITHNPPGTITSETWNLVKMVAESSFRALIIVEGEEDLLALPVIRFSPKSSFVVYGQPYIGLVLVRVTEEKKAEIDRIMDSMDE